MVIDDVRERLRQKGAVEVEQEREELLINSLTDEALSRSNSNNNTNNNDSNNNSSSGSNNKEKENKVKSIGGQICMKIVGEKVR